MQHGGENDRNIKIEEMMSEDLATETFSTSKPKNNRTLKKLHEAQIQVQKDPDSQAPPKSVINLLSSKNSKSASKKSDTKKGKMKLKENHLLPGEFLRFCTLGAYSKDDITVSKNDVGVRAGLGLNPKVMELSD